MFEAVKCLNSVGSQLAIQMGAGDNDGHVDAEPPDQDGFQMVTSADPNIEATSGDPEYPRPYSCSCHSFLISPLSLLH